MLWYFINAFKALKQIEKDKCENGKIDQISLNPTLSKPTLSPAIYGECRYKISLEN